MPPPCFSSNFLPVSLMYTSTSTTSTLTLILCYYGMKCTSYRSEGTGCHVDSVAALLDGRPRLTAAHLISARGNVQTRFTCSARLVKKLSWFDASCYRKNLFLWQAIRLLTQLIALFTFSTDVSDSALSIKVELLRMQFSTTARQLTVRLHLPLAFSVLLDISVLRQHPF